jgi:hypothetical protein
MSEISFDDAELNFNTTFKGHMEKMSFRNAQLHLVDMSGVDFRCRPAFAAPGLRVIPWQLEFSAIEEDIFTPSCSNRHHRDVAV